MRLKSNSDQITDELNELELKIARMNARRNAQINSLQRDFTSATSIPNRSCSLYWSNLSRRWYRYPLAYSLPPRYSSVDNLLFDKYYNSIGRHDDTDIDTSSRRKFVTFNSQSELPEKCKSSTSRQRAATTADENATLLAKLKNLVFEQERRLTNQLLRRIRDSKKAGARNELAEKVKPRGSATGSQSLSKKESLPFLSPINEKDNFYKRYNAFAQKILKPLRKTAKTTWTSSAKAAVPSTNRHRHSTYTASGSPRAISDSRVRRHEPLTRSTSMTGVDNHKLYNYDDYYNYGYDYDYDYDYGDVGDTSATTASWPYWYPRRYPWYRQFPRPLYSAPLLDSPAHSPELGLRHLGLYNRYLRDYDYTPSRRVYPVDIPRDVESIMRDSRSEDDGYSRRRPFASTASAVAPSSPIKYNPFESDSYLRSSLPSWKQYYYTQKLKSKSSNERLLDSYEPYYDFFPDAASLDSTEELLSGSGEDEVSRMLDEDHRQQSPITPEKLIDEYRDAIYEDIIRNLASRKRQLKRDRRRLEQDDIRDERIRASTAAYRRRPRQDRAQPVLATTYPYLKSEFESKKFQPTASSSSRYKGTISSEIDAKDRASPTKPSQSYDGRPAGAAASTRYKFDITSADSFPVDSSEKYGPNAYSFKESHSMQAPYIAPSATSARGTNAEYGEDSLGRGGEPSNTLSRRPFGLLQDEDVTSDVSRYGPMSNYHRKQEIANVNKPDLDYTAMYARDRVPEEGTMRDDSNSDFAVGYSREKNSRPREISEMTNNSSSIPFHSAGKNESKFVTPSAEFGRPAKNIEKYGNPGPSPTSHSFSSSPPLAAARHYLETEKEDTSAPIIGGYHATDHDRRLGGATAISDAHKNTRRSDQPYPTADVENRDRFVNEIRSPEAATNEEKYSFDASDNDRRKFSKPNDFPARYDSISSNYTAVAAPRQARSNWSETTDLAAPPSSRKNSVTSGAFRESAAGSANQSTPATPSLPAPTPSLASASTSGPASTSGRRGSTKPILSRKNSVVRIPGSNAVERRKLLQRVSERKPSTTGDYQQQQSPPSQQQNYRPQRDQNPSSDFDSCKDECVDGTRTDNPANYEYYPTRATATDTNVSSIPNQPNTTAFDRAVSNSGRFDQPNENATGTSTSAGNTTTVTGQRPTQDAGEHFVDNYPTRTTSDATVDQRRSRDEPPFVEYSTDRKSSTVPEDLYSDQNRRRAKPSFDGGGGGSSNNSEGTSALHSSAIGQQVRPAAYDAADNSQPRDWHDQSGSYQHRLETQRNADRDSSYYEDRYEPKHTADSYYNRDYYEPADTRNASYEETTASIGPAGDGAHGITANDRATSAERNSYDQQYSSDAYGDRYEQPQQQNQQQPYEYYQNEYEYDRGRGGEGAATAYVRSNAPQSYYSPQAAPLTESGGYQRENYDHVDRTAVSVDEPNLYNRQYRGYETANNEQRGRSSRPDIGSAYPAVYHYDGDGDGGKTRPAPEYQQQYDDNASWNFDGQFNNQQSAPTGASSLDFNANPQMTTNYEYPAYSTAAAESYSTPSRADGYPYNDSSADAAAVGANELQQFESLEPQSLSLNSTANEEPYSGTSFENPPHQQPWQQNESIAEVVSGTGPEDSQMKESTNGGVASNLSSQSERNNDGGETPPAAVKESADAGAPRRASKVVAQSSTSSEEKKTKVPAQTSQGSEIQKRTSKTKLAENAASKFKRTASNVNKMKMPVKKT